ncbi:MAG: J domain-containing protein [Rhodoferax sp.]|uniref:J domain-containing protein n=1 Tax=Rhodoferax sp. TaxID=50421 RepID=UPI003263180D
MTAPRQIRIVPPQAQSTLSPGQKAFNTLVAKIAKQRDLLLQWQTAADSYRHKVASDYAPLQAQYRAAQVAFANGLDKALGQPGLTKADRKTAAEVICEIARNVLESTGDEAMKALYNQHSPTDWDAELAEEAELDAHFDKAMEDVYGPDVFAENPSQSPEELLAKLLGQQADTAPPRTKKPSAKQQALEAQQKLEDAQTSLSIREVYRKLASALHPDREPDVAERTRKTELMQRVNQAYVKKDLLQLLELQLELEHIDASTMAGLSEDRLKHYNRVLKEQLAELNAETDDIEMGLRMQCGVSPFERLTPVGLIRVLNRDLKGLRAQLQNLQEDALWLKYPLGIKEFVKDYRREAKARQRDMDLDGFNW